MKKVRYLVYGLFGGFVVLCPLVFDCFSALCRFRAAFVCLYALGFIFLLKALLVPGRRLRIALPDVLLALYLSWGACNLLFVKAGGTDALPIFEWISLLLGYLLARSVPERAVPLVLGAIVCSGCVQAAVGFLQWLDVLPSNHNLFPVTGSFMNPGPYGGYLAVCWVVGAGLAIRAVRRRRWPSAAGWAVAVLVVGCLLVLSDSRAAWLAVLLALACAVVVHLFCFVLHSAAHGLPKLLPNPWVRAFLGGCVVVVFTLLYGSMRYNGAGVNIIAAAVEQGQALPWDWIVKILLTALTLSSGFKGGEVVPSFFVGATFGCVAAPLLGIPAGFGAALGLAGVFCGASNCVVASLVLAIELFGAQGLWYFAIVCGITYALSGYAGLYHSQLFLTDKLEPEYRIIRGHNHH